MIVSLRALDLNSTSTRAQSSSPNKFHILSIPLEWVISFCISTSLSWSFHSKSRLKADVVTIISVCSLQTPLRLMTCDEGVSTFKLSSTSLASTYLWTSSLAGGSKHNTLRRGFTALLVWWHSDKRPFSSVVSSDVDLFFSCKLGLQH